MKAFHDDLAAQLATEDTFVAELQALNLGAMNTSEIPGVITGNRPFASLGQERYPCWVLEVGDSEAAAIADDGDGSGLVVGGDRQSFRVEILLALVWHQQAPELAYTQRLDLPGIVARLLLRNLLDGTTNAWLERSDNDRQANHPTHVARFVIAANVTYTR